VRAAWRAYWPVGVLVSPKTWSEGYLSLPGTAGNYASTPDSAAVSITGDIDIRVRVAADSWRPGVSKTFTGKVKNTTNRAYFFDMDSVGRLSLITSPDGTAGNQRQGLLTVATGFEAGSIHWIRVTLDVDDGAGNRIYMFYTSEDGRVWTQLGSTITTAGITSIVDNDSPVEVGALFEGTIQNFSGRIYYAELRNGINGPVVAVFNPSPGDKDKTSITASTGEVWTLSQTGGTPAMFAY